MESINSKKINFTEEQIQEIEYATELSKLYIADGLNRLKIWKEFRNAGFSGDIILEAFRRVGLLER